MLWLILSYHDKIIRLILFLQLLPLLLWSMPEVQEWRKQVGLLEALPFGACAPAEHRPRPPSSSSLRLWRRAFTVLWLSTMPDIPAGLQTMKLFSPSVHLWAPCRHPDTRVPDTSPRLLTVFILQNHVKQIIGFYRAPVCLLRTVSGALSF